MFVRQLIIAAAAILASTVAVSTVANAEDAHVAYKPSELTTDAGRQAVVNRIDRAAKLACGYGRTLTEINSNRKCTKELSSQMVAKLSTPQLAAQPDSRKVASR